MIICSHAFSSRLAVAILRMPKGLDYSHLNIGVSPYSHTLGGMTTSSSMSNITQMEIGNNDANGKRKPNEEHTIMPADSYLNLTTLNNANGTENGNRLTGIYSYELFSAGLIFQSKCIYYCFSTKWQNTN